MIETKILKEPQSVNQRLADMDLRLDTLLKVRDIALSSAADATPFHPANAAGTFAYQDATWALRNYIVGEEWKPDRSDGVEAIKNESCNIRVAFSNVDKACEYEHDPKPRSTKGAGAERACMGNNLFGRSDDLPRYVPGQSGGTATYYLMVDQNGAVELSRPTIKEGTFGPCVERIYLSDSGDVVINKNLRLDDDDRADDFDPHVVRK